VTAGADLHAAYRVCRRMQRRHDPTYYWATLRLPREVRPAVHALYGFVRYADEIVDGPSRSSDPAVRRQALDGWQVALEHARHTGTSREPIIAALVDAERRHDLPLDELSIYMDSMRVDCGPVRLATESDLDRYMRGSAGAVGLIMAPLLGTPVALRPAMAQLGAAFQLTNFLRDVREDFTLDRVYLPAEGFARHGASVADIAAHRMSDGLRRLIAAEVSRARGLFERTRSVHEAVHPSVRSGILLARSIYERVLDQIEVLDFDVVSAPVRVPLWQLGWAALGALAPAR
jgi:phytoene synthase